MGLFKPRDTLNDPPELSASVQASGFTNTVYGTKRKQSQIRPTREIRGDHPSLSEDELSNTQFPLERPAKKRSRREETTVRLLDHRYARADEGEDELTKLQSRPRSAANQSVLSGNKIRSTSNGNVVMNSEYWLVEDTIKPPNGSGLNTSNYKVRNLGWGKSQPYAQAESVGSDLSPRGKNKSLQRSESRRRDVGVLKKFETVSHKLPHRNQMAEYQRNLGPKHRTRRDYLPGHYAPTEEIEISSEPSTPPQSQLTAKRVSHSKPRSSIQPDQPEDQRNNAPESPQDQPVSILEPNHRPVVQSGSRSKTAKSEQSQKPQRVLECDRSRKINALWYVVMPDNEYPLPCEIRLLPEKQALEIHVTSERPHPSSAAIIVDRASTIYSGEYPSCKIYVITAKSTVRTNRFYFELETHQEADALVATFGSTRVHSKTK